MSDASQGEGWWLANDGKWYPPQPTQPAAPAWWLASDGKWYPPQPTQPPAPQPQPNEPAWLKLARRKILIFPLWAYVLMALLVISINLNGGDTADQQTAAEPAPTASTAEPTTPPEPTAEPVSLTQALGATIIEELGGSSRNINPKSTVLVDDNIKTVIVQWAANESLTSGLAVDDMQKDTLDVIGHLQESGIGYDLLVRITFPLVDTLGQSSEEMVVEANYSSARVAAMNPHNMDFHDSWSVADLGAFVHPALDREGSNTSTVAPAPAPAATTFGGGSQLVGESVVPGRYVTFDGGDCYWERLSGLSGELDDTLANHLSGSSQVVVDILKDDVAFNSQGCGDWELVADLDLDPLESFGDGDFLVGIQVQPGRYESIDALGDCYWERTSGFSGDLDEILANDLSAEGSAIVEISASDVGFSSAGCLMWLPIE